jgi:hypothetical protein
VIKKSMRLKYEPASEPLCMFCKVVVLEMRSHFIETRAADIRIILNLSAGVLWNVAVVNTNMAAMSLK